MLKHKALPEVLVADLDLSQEKVAFFLGWVRCAQVLRGKLKRGEGFWNYVQRHVVKRYPTFGRLSEGQLRRLTKRLYEAGRAGNKTVVKVERWAGGDLTRSQLYGEVLKKRLQVREVSKREAQALVTITSILDQLDLRSMERMGDYVNWYIARKKIERTNPP